MTTVLIVLSALLASGWWVSLDYGDSQPGGGVDGTAGKGEPAPGRYTAAEALPEPPPYSTGSGACSSAPGPNPSTAATVARSGACRGESASGDAAGATVGLSSSPRPTVPTPMGVSWRAPAPRPASWAVPAPAWTTGPVDDDAGTTFNANGEWRALPERPDATTRSDRSALLVLAQVGEWGDPGQIRLEVAS